MSVKYLGVYTSKIFDGRGSIKYFGGSTPPKYLTDVGPSNIWGVYTSKTFDKCMSVKYLGGLQPPKYLTDVDPSNIWGV